MSNYVIDFWYGRISLWKSYWIVGELFNALFILALYNIEIRLFNNILIFNQNSFFTFNGFSFVSKIILFCWTVFITVGIWRSAEAYGGKFIWIFLTLLVLSYRLFGMRLLF
tara:strand:+ start:545 stop:877 length:333 start_codon:yes stop_codon:yes gene_type:complete